MVCAICTLSEHLKHEYNACEMASQHEELKLTSLAKTEPSMSNFSHFCAYGMLSEPPTFSMGTLSLRVRRAAGKLAHMMRRFFGAVKPLAPALPTSGC
jgi:hypothetical protein